MQIQVASDLIEVAPGNAESTAFTIKNLGTQVEEFSLSVSGPEWLAVEPATMSVFPGNEATGTVQAAPPRAPGSLAGVTPFRLTVTSVLHAYVSSSASGRVEVAPFYEFAAGLVPTSSRGRGLTSHRVTLDNRGNVPLRVALNPTDVADGLRVEVSAAADVPPGSVVEVPVSVYGSRRWVGRPEPIPFTVIAEPPKPLAPARLPGTRVIVPLFPKWVPIAAAGLAVAAVAAAAAIPKLTAHNTASSTSSSSTAPATPPTTPAPTSAAPTTPAPTSAAPTTAAPTPTTASPTPPPTPAISAVRFTGGATTPTVIIDGYGFGASAPTGISDNTTPCGGYTDNGDVYASNLHFVDVGSFSAGSGIPPSGDCIGVKVQSWTTDKVIFTFGNAYHSFDHWFLTAGDQYNISVNNLTYTGTVSFS